MLSSALWGHQENIWYIHTCMQVKHTYMHVCKTCEHRKEKETNVFDKE